MATVLSDQLGKRLEALATDRHTSVEALLESYIIEQERYKNEQAGDEQILQVMENGEEYDNDEVMKWLDSWGTDKVVDHCPKRP